MSHQRLPQNEEPRSERGSADRLNESEPQGSRDPQLKPKQKKWIWGTGIAIAVGLILGLLIWNNIKLDAVFQHE